MCPGSRFSYGALEYSKSLPETRRQVNRHVPVSLLEPVVLGQVVEVVTSDDDGPLHLHLLHYSSEDAASDGDIAREGTLLVNVCAFNGLER